MNRKSTATNLVITVLLGVTLILSAIDPTAARAAASAPAARATPTATNTPEPTATVLDTTPTKTVTPAPTETPISYEPALTLQSDPTYITPGGQVTFLYQISNLEKFTETTVLRFHIPFGFAPLSPEEGKYDEAAGIFEVIPTSSEGKIAWQADETIVTPLGIFVDLIQDDKTIAEAKLELTAPVEYKIEATGGTAESADGEVQVNFPAGAVAETVTVKVTEPSYEALPIQSLSGSPFEITAVSETSKEEVTQFDEPVEIWVNYDEGSLSGSEDDLLLFWYDPTDGQWKQPLSQRVDKENNRIIATTDHFTVFDIYNSNWQSAQTPSLSGFQTSDFIGAASFSLPIKVPPGPGGLQPSLGLSYSSMVVDGASSESQASWVGMGWSLTTSAVERNGHGTNGALDDSYQLTLNGMSVELLPDGIGNYRASSENFYRVEFSDPQSYLTSKWTIWDKSGYKYIFDFRTKRTRFDACVTTDGAELGYDVWRWSLSEVVNPFGQSIHYYYEHETSDHPYGDCGGGHHIITVQNWVYPRSIVYANGKYAILFDRSQTRFDYKNLWLNANAYANVFQRSLLDGIRVMQETNGDGLFTSADTIIREYRFTYVNNQKINIFPDLIWDAGGKTPTLFSVQEYGLGGYQAVNPQSLPAYDFNYDDGMHLTSATNGYGGTITFTYNDYNHDGTVNPGIGEIPWGESIPAGVDGGYPVINSNKKSGWSRRTGSGLCFQGTGDNPVLRFFCEIKNPVKVNGINSILPGRHYTVIAEVQADRVGTQWGTWAKIGLVYKVGDNWQADQYSASSDLQVTGSPIPNNPIPVTIIFDVVIPPDATEVMALMNSNGARVNSYKLIPVTTVYRVTQQTVSTGGDSLTFEYDYVGASTNTPAVSTAAEGPHPYIKPYTEFRGHSQVTVKSPFGGKTVTLYHQSDCYAGSPEGVLVKDASGTTVQESSYTYYGEEEEDGCSTGNSSIQLVDQDTRNPFLYGTQFDPLKFYWARTVSATTTTHGTVGGSLVTSYEYESTYGNLVSQEVTGSIPHTLTTEYQYITPIITTEKYIVSLPTRVAVSNGTSTLAESLTYYDGNGIPVKTRTLMNTGQYSQMDVGYDTWGNVTSQTIYTEYSNGMNDPASGAQTAIITYDAVYHTYPLTITNALNQTTTLTYNYTLGVPLTAYGPNGTATTVSAEYDSFGRLVKLIRPGDDSASPTLQIAYTGTNPFTTTLTQKIQNGQYYTVTRQYDGLGRPTSATAGGVTTIYQYGATNGVRYDKVSMPGETAHFVTTNYDSLGRPSEVIAPDLTEINYGYYGLMTTVTDANGNLTSTTSDILGRTVFVDAPIGPDITFGYNDLGNLTSASRGGATTTMEYDLGGRKTSMSDPDMGAWTYDYNALSNLLAQTDARGCTLTMEYDDLNRLDTKASSGNCGQQVSVDYDYDEGTYGIGFRTSMEDASGSASWTYDERGRLTSEDKTITGTSFLTQWTYNSADMPVSMIYPDGETVTTQYNSNMLLVNVAGAETYASAFGYDSVNRLTQLTLGNNAVSSRYYYKAWNVQGGGRLDMSVIGNGAYNDASKTFANLLLKNTYAYDSVGNITNIASVSDSWSETQAFTYDELYRLKTASATGGLADYSEVYQYDTSTGNLVDKNGLILNYPAANGARPHAVTSAGSNTYAYDDNGNQTTRNIGGNIYTLGYDAENRLVSVTGPSLTGTFTYDGDGRRVKSVVNGETILFAGGHYEQKGNEVTKYYFAGASRIAVRKYIVPQSSTLTYLAGDHLGSTSLAVDASTGDVIETRYKPWGEVRYTTPSKTLPTRYTFTGQYSYIDDSATDLGAAGFGLMFYNARWYDPALGRMVQADSIVPGGLQGLDRYAYVSNNPVAFTDPSGHAQYRSDYQNQIHGKKIYQAWGESLPECSSNSSQNHYCKLQNGIIIDVSHFNFDGAMDFWNDVLSCVENHQKKCTVTLSQPAGDYEFQHTYTIDLTHIANREQLASVAGGIWWKFQVAFEEWEGTICGPCGWHSTFRAEDIPTAYLAFIAAIYAEKYGWDRDTVFKVMFGGAKPTASGLQPWYSGFSDADKTCWTTGYCDFRTPRTSSIFSGLTLVMEFGLA